MPRISKIWISSKNNFKNIVLNSKSKKEILEKIGLTYIQHNLNRLNKRLIDENLHDYITNKSELPKAKALGFSLG